MKEGLSFVGKSCLPWLHQWSDWEQIIIPGASKKRVCQVCGRSDYK